MVLVEMENPLTRNLIMEILLLKIVIIKIILKEINKELYRTNKLDSI